MKLTGISAPNRVKIFTLPYLPYPSISNDSIDVAERYVISVDNNIFAEFLPNNLSYKEDAEEYFNMQREKYPEPLYKLKEDNDFIYIINNNDNGRAIVWFIKLKFGQLNGWTTEMIDELLYKMNNP